MMHQGESFSLVTGKQYGSRNGKSTSIQSLNKRLAFDLICQTQHATIICSNNAKSPDCSTKHAPMWNSQASPYDKSSVKVKMVELTARVRVLMSSG